MVRRAVDGRLAVVHRGWMVWGGGKESRWCDKAASRRGSPKMVVGRGLQEVEEHALG